MVMAGVLERLFRQGKRTFIDHKAMELQAAREILAEVFGVRLAEVDQMIRSRFEAENEGPKENKLWPQEFRLE